MITVFKSLRDQCILYKRYMLMISTFAGRSLTETEGISHVPRGNGIDQQGDKDLTRPVREPGRKLSDDRVSIVVRLILSICL